MAIRFTFFSAKPKALERATSPLGTKRPIEDSRYSETSEGPEPKRLRISEPSDDEAANESEKVDLSGALSEEQSSQGQVEESASCADSHGPYWRLCLLSVILTASSCLTLTHFLQTIQPL